MDNGLSLTGILVMLGSVILSLGVHESMHAWVGLKLGDTTAQEEGRISFNPLSHIDPYMTIVLPIMTTVLFGIPVLAAKPVPFNPARVKWDEYGAALIALAGPLSNFGLAIIAALFIRLIGSAGFLVDVLTLFAAINVGIGVFNLVPIPPLDGSRVLYAFAPESVQEFMVRMEVYGLFVIFALVILFQPFSEILGNINAAILRVLL